MPQVRGLLARLVTAVGCVAVALTVPAPATAAAPAAPAAATVSAATATVTLLTGDAVTVTRPAGGQPSVAVRPGAGSRSFTTLRQGSDLYVVPDAVEHLVPDVLDLELFNVTALVDMGYADSVTDSLPLIVRGPQPFAARSGTLALPSIGASAVSVRKGDGARVLADQSRAARSLGGSKVWLDRKLSAAELDGNLTQIGAPDAWSSGLSGAGVDVAVLDTGVDSTHPDLKGKVAAEADFTADGTPADGNGHGTHVASIVAGTGAAATGDRRGVAYGARLLSGKVLGADGSGQASWVIAGMQWAAAQGADVVNLSLGGPAAKGDDPVALALDALTAQTGALFVVAAGNSGGWGLVESPGVAASALTVGASDSGGRVAGFSAKGPTRGTYRAKPDLTAPGVGIVGARAGGGTADPYTTMDGTSQATPHVTGAAALLRQQHPDWDWQRIKTTLMTTADVHTTVRPVSNEEGAGQLDLRGATSETLVLNRSTVDFGYRRHPAGTDPASIEVTLTNTGKAAQTVTATDLAYDVYDGKAPDDLVTIEPASLTVAPGATERLTVTLTPANAEPGVYIGAVTLARGGGLDPISLPLNLYDEAPRHDLHLTVLDRHGEPYAGGTVWLGNMNELNPRAGGGFTIVQLDGNGQGTARMAPGAISAVAKIETPAAGAAPATVALAGSPEVMLDKDVSFTIDAREAKQLTPATVREVKTTLARASVQYVQHDATVGDFIGDAIYASGEEITNGQVFLQPTKPTTTGEAVFETRWDLDGVVGRGKPAEQYRLVLGGPTVPDPPVYSASRSRSMARLDSDYRGMGPGKDTYGEYWQAVTDLVPSSWVFGESMTAPVRRTEWVTARPDVRWSHCLSGVVELCAPAESFRAGSRPAPVWFRAAAPAMVLGAHDRTRIELQVGLSDGQHQGMVRDYAGWGPQTLRLFRDGVEVPRLPDSYWFDTPPEPATFRLEHTATPDQELLPIGRRIETAWTFPSVAPTAPDQWSTAPRVLGLDYRPPVDSAGRLPAWRSLVLSVRLTASDGREEPLVTERGTLRFWTSLDGGRRWVPAIVVPQHDSFLVVAPMAPRPGQAVSVRAEGSGASGRSVEQTIIDAYPVR